MWAVSSAVEHSIHIAGVTGSIPVPPTISLPLKIQPAAPDATITLDFALARMTQVVQKLVVYPARMQENLDRTRGLVHSQRVMLALTQAGVSREDSYRMVQRNAMQTWEGKHAGRDDVDFEQQLRTDPEIQKYLPPEELDRLCQLDFHFQHVNERFKQLGL